jgi:hypothetical protein
VDCRKEEKVKKLRQQNRQALKKIETVVEPAQAEIATALSQQAKQGPTSNDE